MTDAPLPSPDPFDAMRQPTGSVVPRAEFAADLRARLSEQIRGGSAMTGTSASTLTDASTSTSTSTPTTAAATPTISAATPTTSAAPASVSAVPYLIVRRGTAALDFYRNALGAVELMRYVDDEGTVGHAELMIGTTKFALADEYADLDLLGPESRGGATCTFQLHVPDVDAAYARAVAGGATGVRQPEDQFHGNRTADVRDPFGHRWLFTAPVQVQSDAEADAAAAELGLTITRNAAADVVADAVPDVVPDQQLKHYDTGDLYYFTIPVASMAKAQTFFGAVLGWQFDDPQAGHASNISAPPGGVREMAEPTETQLWFVVDDIHTAVDRVRAAGGTADEPVDYESGWSVDCVDDQGTKFSLSVPVAKYRL